MMLRVFLIDLMMFLVVLPWKRERPPWSRRDIAKFGLLLTVVGAVAAVLEARGNPVRAQELQLGFAFALAMLVAYGIDDARRRRLARKPAVPTARN
jgi:drug/metabolite transporter (DMT)-like permease